MNNAKTAIMIDSGCDLEQEFIEKYDIVLCTINNSLQEGIVVKINEDDVIDFIKKHI